MAYTVVEVAFRTELHARWSAAFDVLRVPWVYEPVAFRDAAGATHTPAFWLPQQRIWFTAELEAPAWWWQFAVAAEGRYDERGHVGHGGKEAESHPAVVVPAEWRGLTVLSEGPFIPDSDPSPTNDPDDGPWRLHDNRGMYTCDDAMYQWTICPQCGLFGAEYCGYAERLPCSCLDDLKNPEHRKVCNSSDKRLLTAYAWANNEPWQPADLDHGDTLLLPTVSKALVARPDAEEQYGDTTAPAREEAPIGAADSRCVRCRQRPAAAPADACLECAQAPLLLERRARQRINWRVDQLSRATGQSGRDINKLLNDAVGVRSRSNAPLAAIGAALTLAERWLEDPTSMPDSQPPLTEADLAGKNGADLRKLLTTFTGPLAKTFGVRIPLVQKHLNDWMGIPSRSEATDEQLRDAILQAQTWLADPATYQACVYPPTPVPDGLPAPIHTKPAPTDTSCSLCTSPVAAGEVIGRMPTPRPPLVPFPWLCAHCLFDRRAKPRLTDAVLRIYHHTFSGNATTPLNTAEARVLHEALTHLPAAARTDLTQEAADRLHEAVEAPYPVMRLSHAPALAAVFALRSAGLTATDAEAAVLGAVAHHLDQWENVRSGVDEEPRTQSIQWRQDVLQEAPPTVLSQRGGPFWV